MCASSTVRVTHLSASGSSPFYLYPFECQLTRFTFTLHILSLSFHLAPLLKFAFCKTTKNIVSNPSFRIATVKTFNVFSFFLSDGVSFRSCCQLSWPWMWPTISTDWKFPDRYSCWQPFSERDARQARKSNHGQRKERYQSWNSSPCRQPSNR